jgi:predicted RNA methylase
MMNAQYLPGMEHERRKPELSQWFTPPALASRVWSWANRHIKAKHVLEPAAGQGALIKPIYANPRECTRVVAIDIDPRNVRILDILADRANERPDRTETERWDAAQGDFLRMYRDTRTEDFPLFDLALMNPPYEDGRAEQFILHALTVSARVVGIFKASILFGQERHRTLWQQAHVLREARLMSRPSFGRGDSSDSAKSDFVVLEIRSGRPGETQERCVLTENWP